MKTRTAREAVDLIRDGATLMIGGFMGVGSPERVIDELVRQGRRDLSVIANDTAMPGRGIGKLVSAGVLRKVVVSHIGLNPETQQQMIAGRLQVELVPQGTLIERIRAGGYGLGGVLTPTGVGTIVEEGKRRIEVEGRPYLLETRSEGRLRPGAGLRGRLPGQPGVRAHRAQLQPGHRHGGRDGDRRRGADRARRRDPAGRGDDAGGAGRLPRGKGVSMDALTLIARRIALELREGMLVNLGIGIPTLVAGFVPAGMRVYFQSENGLIGTGPLPEHAAEQARLTDAGGRPVTAIPGACTFDSATSFGLIRGGHVDMTVLGGLQVDARGLLANWMIPGKMVPGMGGAMDLVTGSRKVVVAMQHTAKGEPKIVERCSLPLTSVRPVDLIVTELAVIAQEDGRLRLLETAPGVSVEQVLAATEARLDVARHVRTMAIV